MRIRTQRNELIEISGKKITPVKTPTGSFQILAHNKEEGSLIGEYSTEEKTIRVICAIQVAVNHPEKIKIFRMPKEDEVC